VVAEVEGVDLGGCEWRLGIWEEACEAAVEGEGRGGGGQEGGQLGVEVGGDDQACGAGGGAADGVPRGSRELTCAIEEDEVAAADGAGEGVGGVGVEGAILGEVEPVDAMAEGAEVWGEGVEEGRFSGAVRADDGGAAIEGVEAVEDLLPRSVEPRGIEGQEPLDAVSAQRVVTGLHGGAAFPIAGAYGGSRRI
jgi:hypothetical protein